MSVISAFTQRLTTSLTAVACAATLMLAGCEQKDAGSGGDSGADTQPQTAAATPVSQTTVTPTPEVIRPIAQQGDGSPPQLTFDRPIHAFGDMLETETRDADIRFTNTGGSPLIIQNITTTCGCTAATLTKYTYAPGESGSLGVSFDPTGPNEPNQPQRKYVNIFSNANPNGQATKMMITANVKPFIILDPKMVTMGRKMLNEEQRETLRISCIDPEFELVDVKTDLPILGVVRLPAEHDEFTQQRWERVQIVVPSSAPWGGHYSRIDVTVRGKTSPDAEPTTFTREIRFGVQLYGQLVAQPRDRFSFGLAPNDTFSNEVTLMREDGRPFKVLNHQLQAPTIPNVELKLRQVTPASWAFTLTGRGGPVATNYHGKVIVRTDVPGEELIELPIFGVVRDRQGG